MIRVRARARVGVGVEVRLIRLRLGVGVGVRLRVRVGESGLRARQVVDGMAFGSYWLLGSRMRVAISP